MTTFVDYPTVDIDALNSAAAAAGTAGIETERLYTQSEYLPSLSSKILNTDQALRTAHFQLKRITDATATGIRLDISTLERYQAALKRATGSSVSTIIKRLDQQIVKVRSSVSETRTSLDALCAPLKEPVDRSATRGFLAQLSSDQSRLPIETQALIQRKDELERQRQALTDALALLESKGIAQIGKDTILDAQKLSQLAMAGPELAAVQIGIEFAQQALENLESLVSYIGIANARDIVRKQIDNLLTQIEGSQRALHLINLRHALISAIHQFDDQRNIYVVEFSKIVMATESFLDKQAVIDIQNERAVAQFVTDSLKLARYVDAVA
jgi:hypothetical protein